jgi:hypothetical protein
MVRAAGVETPDQFQRFVGTEEIHRFLGDRLKVLPQADAVGFVGADGRLINSSRFWPVPDLDLSDREYYKDLRQYEHPGMFISAPVVSRFTGAWVFFLARRIDGPHGFVGLVLSTIDIRYMEGFLPGDRDAGRRIGRSAPPRRYDDGRPSACRKADGSEIGHWVAVL